MLRGWPALIWGVVCFGLIAGAGLLLWSDLSFRAHSVEGHGTVVQAGNHLDGSGQRIDWTIIEWADLDGGVHRYESTSGYPGDSVSFRYDPAHPEDTRRSHTVVIVLLAFMGFFFTGLLFSGLKKRGT